MTDPRDVLECLALHCVCDHAAASAAAAPPAGMTDAEYDLPGTAFVELIGEPRLFATWLAQKFHVRETGTPYVAAYVPRVPGLRLWLLGTEAGGGFGPPMLQSMAAARAYADELGAEGFEVYVDGMWSP